MNLKNLAQRKSAIVFVNLAILLLGVVSFIIYLIYATSTEGLMTPWVIVFLITVIIGEILLFFFDNDYLPIIIAGAFMLAFGCFAYSPPETIGSIVDYFQNIVMFGDPEKFGIIVTLLGLMLVGSIAAIVSCFFERIKR